MSNALLVSPEQPLPSPVLTDARALSSTVLVAEGLTAPSHLSFAAATSSRPGLQQVGTVALLLHVVHLVTGELDLTIHKLASPDYETAVSYMLAIIGNNAISKELPDDRYDALRLAADPSCTDGCSMLSLSVANGSRPSKRRPHMAATFRQHVAARPKSGNTLPRGHNDGTIRQHVAARRIPATCYVGSSPSSPLSAASWAWQTLGALSRRLVEGPILNQLLCKIENLPAGRGRDRHGDLRGLRGRAYLLRGPGQGLGLPL
jgi:hypothetical protein